MTTKCLFKKIIKAAILPLFIPAALYAYACVLQAAPLFAQPPYSLDKQLQDLINNTIPNTDIGLMIMNADTGRIVYQHNGYHHYTPASTTKLFTTAAALYYLKPTYQYTTTVYIKKSTPVRAEFEGNIYIKFTGDPSYTQESLASLIKKIKEKGIQTIKGNIILDTNTFSGSPYPQGMNIRDIQWSYGAPITSLILNRNGVPISIKPSDTLQKPVDIKVSDNYKHYFPIHSDVTTVTMSDAEYSCEINAKMSEYNVIDIKGCWPIDKPAYKKLALINPTHFAIQLIRAKLKKEHMQLRGAIKIGKTPNTTTALIQQKSKPLSKLLGHMLHFSDNVYANAFLKTMGAAYSNQSGDFFNGVRVLKSVLAQHTDINFKNMTLFDGAGMSGYNLITPYQLSQLLYSTFHSPKIKAYFINALPEPTKNGTLENRMHAFGLSNNVHAKTGTMTGTSTLAGYVTAENRHNYIFAFMVNHHVGSTSDLRILEDQLVALIRSTKYESLTSSTKP